MKKQIKTNWQTIAFAAIPTVVFMFAANSFGEFIGSVKIPLFPTD